MDPMQPPPPAAFNVQQEYQKKKKDLEQAFKDFHELVGNKVLDSNKSPALKRTELQTIDALVRAAQALDNINMGEGILALASIAVREQLIVRDRVNDLEYELCIAQRDIEKIKKKIGLESDKKKQ